MCAESFFPQRIGLRDTGMALSGQGAFGRILRTPLGEARPSDQRQSVAARCPGQGPEKGSTPPFVSNVDTPPSGKKPGGMKNFVSFGSKGAMGISAKRAFSGGGPGWGFKPARGPALTRFFGGKWGGTILRGRLRAPIGFGRRERCLTRFVRVRRCEGT